MTEFVDLEIFVTQLKRVGFHIRDLGLLESALARPQTSLFGEDAYPTLELKAAVMVESIILNHPMVDGNKRSSWLALNLFVEMNDFEIIATQDAVFDYVLDVAYSSSRNSGNPKLISGYEMLLHQAVAQSTAFSSLLGKPKIDLEQLTSIMRVALVGRVGEWSNA